MFWFLTTPTVRLLYIIIAVAILGKYYWGTQNIWTQALFINRGGSNIGRQHFVIFTIINITPHPGNQPQGNDNYKKFNPFFHICSTINWSKNPNQMNIIHQNICHWNKFFQQILFTDFYANYQFLY